MDNLKYYNDSLAYDFSLFLPAENKEKEENIVKMPKPVSKKRVRAAKRSVSLSAFAVMTAGFMLAALCGNIFLRIRVNEINSQINEIKSEIAVLESERTGLQVELERRISYSNVELEATELGMKKMDKEQVKYIRVNEKNTAVTSGGELVCESN